MEFQPSPAENRRLVRTQYTVPATLLVAFQDDAIDESAEMAALLRQVQPMGASRMHVPQRHRSRMRQKSLGAAGDARFLMKMAAV